MCQAVADANARAAQILAQSLVPVAPAGALRHVVVAPGSRHTPLVLALAGLRHVQLQMVLDERAAGFLALGLAKRTGAATVLCCTSGSAGAHFLPAVVEASVGRVPLLVLTADRPAELHNCGAPQTMPQNTLFAGYVRRQWTLPPPEPAMLASVLAAWRLQSARALALAEHEAPGPVHLNVPFREPLWQRGAVPEGPQPPANKAPLRIACAPRGVAADVALAMARRLQQAQRGLIVVGPLGVCAAGRAAAQAGLDLARRLGWPCLVDACSQLRFCAPTPGAAGFCRVTTADLLVRQAAFVQRLGAPDCIVRLGGLPTSKALWRWLGRVGAEAGTTTVFVDAQNDWADPAQVGDLAVTARPQEFWQALEPHLEAGGELTPWCLGWQQGQATALSGLLRQLQDTAVSPVCATEAHVASVLAAALPAAALLHVASSMPIRDLETFGHSCASPQQDSLGPRISCSRGVNGIDGTLATLLGLALSRHESPVVGLMGDLAFLHDVASLQLARQLQVPAVAIVLNNAGGDIFAHLPIAGLAAADLPVRQKRRQTPFDEYFRTPQKADIAALCRAAHVAYRGVRLQHEFVAVLAELLQRGASSAAAAAPAAETTTSDASPAASAASAPCHAGLVVIEVRIDAALSRQCRQRLIASVIAGLNSP